MKSILKYISLAAAVLAGAVIVSCGGNIDTEESGGALLLKVFPEGIVADGSTAAVFTVSENGEDVSAEAVITCSTTGENVVNCEFTTSSAGTYTFTASYNNQKSNTVTVRAVAPGDGVRVFVDREQIEADGKDAVKLILKDRNDRILNEYEQDFVHFTVRESGEEFKRRNEFTAVENGTYTIAVKWKGEPCANTVRVTAVNRSRYEKYYHIIPIYDLTNIQCYYCSVYAKGLEEIPALYKGHSLPIGIHGNYSNNDPWLYLTSTVATNILATFGAPNAYPTVIYNFDYIAPSNATTEYTGTGISQRIAEQMKKYPAGCGVKLSGSYDETAGKVSISVSMTSVKAARYDLGCALLLDNQNVSEISTHFSEVDDILVAITGNYRGMSTDGSFTSVADQEVTRDWIFDLDPEFVARSGGVGNFRVVGFALTEENGKVRFDNANVCPLGGSEDYRLN